MFQVKSFILTEVKYDFTLPDAENINLVVQDVIKIEGMEDKTALADVKRILDFGEGTDSYVSVTYSAVIDCSETMTVEKLVDMIKDNLSKFRVIYGKESLIISQLTEASPIGVIVTPPACRKDTLQIKVN